MSDTAQIDEKVQAQKRHEDARRKEGIPEWVARLRPNTARGPTDTSRGPTDTSRGPTDTSRGPTDTTRGFGIGGPGTDSAVGDIFHAAASLGGLLVVSVVSPISASIRNPNSAPRVSYSALSPDDAATLARLKRLEFERDFLETNTKR